MHHEKPVDSSHTPYRCIGLKARRGGRRSAGDEWFMAAVQISLLCSGLSVAFANTTCWRETDSCVCDGERGFHFTHPETRATDVV